MHAIKMSDLYKALGFKGSKIPADYVCTKKKVYLVVDGLPPSPPNILPDLGVTLRVTITPSHSTEGYKSSQHRVHVHCPTCGFLIPAGRLHQHIGKKTCLKHKAETEHMVNPNRLEEVKQFDNVEDMIASLNDSHGVEGFIPDLPKDKDFDELFAQDNRHDTEI